ncbi:MAG: hypothetical protein AAGD28_13475 [Bacteroidota bacterium]
MKINKLFEASLSDFKLIFRNPALRIFLGVPILVLLMVFLLLPYLLEKYPIVDEYTVYILMAALMQCSTMFGFIYCMVFIDEKDTGVAKVYGILPLNKIGFMLVRLSFPVLYSSLFNILLLSLQTFVSISIIENVLVSVLSALIAPILGLLVAILSKNKMQGLTWFKIINLFVNLPLLAFFFPSSKPILGILPTFWPFQLLYQSSLDLNIALSAILGFVFCSTIILLLTKRFTQLHYH